MYFPYGIFESCLLLIGLRTCKFLSKIKRKFKKIYIKKRFYCPCGVYKYLGSNIDKLCLKI